MIFIVVLALLMNLIILTTSNESNSVNANNATIVTIEVFGESHCPDTTRFFHKHMLPVWHRFGYSGRLKIYYHPFGIHTFCNKNNGDFRCRCHHGPMECLQNQLQACVISAEPDTSRNIEIKQVESKNSSPDYGKFSPNAKHCRWLQSHRNDISTTRKAHYVGCIQGKYDLSTSIRECIQIEEITSRIDTNFVKKCATSALGRQLMSIHGEIEARKAPTLNWVPWIMINGIRDNEAEYNLWNILCRKYLVPRPVECDN